MKLCNILKGLNYNLLQGSDEIEINNITYDSRKSKEDYLFACLKGYKDDGHRYINQAYLQGTKVFLVEKEVQDLPLEATIIKVTNVRLALPIISANFYNHPSRKIKLIGVTGTNGKTSVTSLISSVLSFTNNRVGTIGTLGYKIGDCELDLERTTPTTPESLELQSIFNYMYNKNIENIIMEVSSMALKLHRTNMCDFDLGIFTNLTQDHLDDHGTYDDYKNSKLKLFQNCNTALINIDDPNANEVLAACKHQIKTFGIDNNADIRAQNIIMKPYGVGFIVNIKGDKRKVEVPIPGKFTIYNTLAVIGACLHIGLDIDKIILGLSKVKNVSGRFQPIKNHKDITVIVDYAHTPDALENVLQTIKEFAKGKIYTVFGCGGDRDKTKRSIMGRISSMFADHTFITSDNPRTEKPLSIIREIEEGIKEIGRDNYTIIEDRKEAITKALSLASSQDIVLVAGKGNETYQIIGNQIIPFDDAKVIQNYWNNLVDKT